MFITRPFLNLFFAGCILLMANVVRAKEIAKTDGTDTLFTSDVVSGMKFRSIGPAFSSGRIADFAVNPMNHSEFYVAVASGNIWKTTNNGITFDPVFDNYGAYSIGCLAIDASNTNVIWAGTGENNHQRALGYGDGVYLSVDAGKTWKNMGLKNSRQIGMILIDPRNSSTVYVAAEGSVWGPGGDRGLYKTTDKGATWTKILAISEHTGVNNIICDPRNPDILYATSEQRRRHVHTKVGGGPETAVYKSEDAGKTWRKIMSGLPSEHIGGMGLAISPQNPDVLYIIAEAANNAGGFFRSSDRGESWEKMSDHAESGQYYNEIFCDPVDFDKVYSVETFSHLTSDGGKTWAPISTKDRHVDDHALWINPTNNKHFMIGGDGGVYITYDAGENWRQVSNLPVTQFYRVTVDNQKPFYNVYGGTQDNATQGGPSQNTSSAGVTSSEWIVTVFGDGFWSRVDPKNPDIVYSEWQYGNVVRYDKKNGERLYIKPQPRKDELTYRWNWNTPLIISNHKSSRLYMAANKLFRSNDYGNTWDVISEDLTAQIDRNSWPVMGKFWSVDAVAKDVSTSQYGTIVSLDESPLKEGLIYVGTDDGLIQVTQDEGNTWTKIDKFPGIPAYTYVSDIYASRFDENVVFASFDNMKNDDFKPYILKSTDKGKTWKSISSNLPLNGTVHTLEQDFVNPELLFAGTEFGVFCTVDGGKMWVQMKSGLPTIAVRDMAIQKDACDLVLATFGRGFYILDNYAPLRNLSNETLMQNAYVFPVADALLYIPTGKIYGQGATYFSAPNPKYGATFTVYLKEVPKTLKQTRQDAEKELFNSGKPIPQPSQIQLENEKNELPTYLLVNIKDESGTIIRAFTQSAQKGIVRFNWDLKYNQPEARIRADKFEPLKNSDGGIYVMPGNYTMELSMVTWGKSVTLGTPVKFEVKSLNNSTLPAANRANMVAFQQEVSQFAIVYLGAEMATKDLREELMAIKQTALNLADGHGEIMQKINIAENELQSIDFAFNGSTPKASFEEVPPAILPLNERINFVMYSYIESTGDITNNTKSSFDVLKTEFKPILERIHILDKKTFPEIRKMLDTMGAPYTPGRIPQMK